MRLGLLLRLSEETDGLMRSRSDSDALSRVVYNSAVKTDERIDLVEQPSNNPFSNALFFSAIEIKDSFFIRTKFDSDLAPFFGDGFRGSEVNTVVALLGFNDMKGNETLYNIDMIVFEHAGSTVGFLSPVTTHKTSYAENFTVEFGSHMFLTKNAIVDDYEKGDSLYLISLAKNGTAFSMTTNVTVAKMSESPTEIATSVVDGSYAPLEKDATKNIISLTYVEKKEATATVLSVSKSKTMVYVTSTDAPTLQSVSFIAAAFQDGHLGSPLDYLAKGVKIVCHYYQRYSSYVPVNIYSNIIYII